MTFKTTRTQSKPRAKAKSTHFKQSSSSSSSSNRRPSRRYKNDDSKPRVSLEDRQVIVFNKPYDTLSQFTDGDGRKTLADFIPVKEVYAAGRLDRDSEGLLILTNDGVLQARLTQPSSRSEKTYWVQVDGTPSDAELETLANGVTLKDGPTLPAKVVRMEAPAVWERNPPVRFRANIPTTWLAITIIEGRNRQVRRMTANIGYPTLRLIRASVGKFTLNQLQPGEWESLPADHPALAAYPLN